MIFYCHGFTSDKNGYKNRHKIIEDLLEKENVGSFVRFTKSRLWNVKKNKDLVITTHSQDTLQVIKFVLSKSKEICGSNNTQIYLTGFSAGFYYHAVGAVYHYDPRSEKINAYGRSIMGNLLIHLLYKWKGERLNGFIHRRAMHILNLK